MYLTLNSVPARKRIELFITSCDKITSIAWRPQVAHLWRLTPVSLSFIGSGGSHRLSLRRPATILIRWAPAFLPPSRTAFLHHLQWSHRIEPPAATVASLDIIPVRPHLHRCPQVVSHHPRSAASRRLATCHHRLLSSTQGLTSTARRPRAHRRPNTPNPNPPPAPILAMVGRVEALAEEEDVVHLGRRGSWEGYCGSVRVLVIGYWFVARPTYSRRPGKPKYEEMA